MTIAGETLTVTQAGDSYVAANQLTTLSKPGFSGGGAVVAVDSAGNVYFVDFPYLQTPVIEEWNAQTQQITTLFSLPGNINYGEYYPDGVAVDDAGNVYVTSNTPEGNYPSLFQKWDPSTKSLSTLVSSSSYSFGGLAVDSEDNVYIVNNGVIDKWSPSTQALTTLISVNGLNGPHGVAVDGSGNVYIADTYNSAIKEWNAATGQVTTLVSSGLNYPSWRGGGRFGQRLYRRHGNDGQIKEWNAATRQVTTLVSSGPE